jgi:thiol-disulfide isomerase/thioredoxin
VKTLLPLAIVLVLASAYGNWHKKSRGRIKGKSGVIPVVVATDLAGASTGPIEFGSRVTLLQFSSAFCSPCRATRALLADITEDLVDVRHIDVDAESHLELVRRLDIRSTPTTLILDGDKREVGRAVGAPKRAQVIAAIAAVAPIK